MANPSGLIRNRRVPSLYANLTHHTVRLTFHTRYSVPLNPNSSTQTLPCDTPSLRSFCFLRSEGKIRTHKLFCQHLLFIHAENPFPSPPPPWCCRLVPSTSRTSLSLTMIRWATASCSPASPTPPPTCPSRPTWCHPSTHPHAPPYHKNKISRFSVFSRLIHFYDSMIVWRTPMRCTSVYSYPALSNLPTSDARRLVMVSLILRSPRPWQTSNYTTPPPSLFPSMLNLSPLPSIPYSRELQEEELY